MKKLTTLAITGTFAFVALGAVAAFSFNPTTINTPWLGTMAWSGCLDRGNVIDRLDDKELGIGEYSEHASNDSPRLDDKELGIGVYGEQAFNNSPKLDDKELGIGIYSEQA